MADEGTPPSKRVRLTKDNLKDMSKEELLEKCQEQEAYIEAIVSNKRAPGTAEELVSLRESEEKLKQQQQEATQRENMLVMRLSSKDQEMQDYIVQIQELKQAHNPSAAKLRSMMLDPAVNIMFERMKKEVESCKEKLEQAQNDLAAWKFTPDSQTGKRLMAKCRMLLTENEELGKVISSGRTAKLESEIALEKKFVEEMKLSQAEMDEFLVDMDEDVEGMQSTICLLQQQLKETKELVSKLQAENAKMCAQVVSSQQHQQTLPQQQQQFGCAHTTDDSNSVERTTEAAPTTPEGAAEAPRTTHTPPSVLAANSNTTETAAESHGATDADMHIDDNRVSTPTTPLSEHHGDVSVQLHAAQPAAHSSASGNSEACAQLREVHNGNRTAGDHESVAGHATNDRTEEDDEMVGCPTTNGQVPHEPDLPRHGRQLGDRTEVSSYRYDDETEASRRNSRLHDDGVGLKGGAVFDKTDDARRISRSPTADYEMEGTDLSSDAWSPRSPPVPHHKVATTKQLRGDTAMSDDDDATTERQSLRTDAKSGMNSDVMLNGIVAPHTLTEEQDA